jgi:hypothetical protein
MVRLWKAGLLIGLIYVNSPMRDDKDVDAISQAALSAAAPVIAQGIKVTGSAPAALSDPLAQAALDAARAAVGLPHTPQHPKR